MRIDVDTPIIVIFADEVIGYKKASSNAVTRHILFFLSEAKPVFIRCFTFEWFILYFHFVQNLAPKDLSFVGYTYKNFDAVKGLRHSLGTNSPYYISNLIQLLQFFLVKWETGEFIVWSDIKKNLTNFFSNSVEMARTMSLDRSPGECCVQSSEIPCFICLPLCMFKSESFFHRHGLTTIS